MRIRPLNVIVAVFSFSGIALAQSTTSDYPPSLNTEQNPLRNVSAGALAERSPGNMVSAGVSRTLSAADFGRSIIEITEPMPDPDAKATFLIEAIEILFDGLNNALVVIGNALFERAGLPPLTPTELIAPPVSSE